MVGKRKISVRNDERKHAPVDQIGTIPFGRIFVCNICPTAQHLLAACSLLSRRTISGLYCENRGTEPDVVVCSLRELHMDFIHNFCQLRFYSHWILAIHQSFLRLVDFLCQSDIGRILAGQGKLCQSKRIGAVRACLSGRNQLVCRRNRIVNLGNDLQHQIFRKRAHRRPVLDIRTEMDFHRGICHTMGIKYAILINLRIKMILIFADGSVEFSRRCQASLICRSRRNRTGIHQSYRSDLAVLQLGAFTVREVSCRMTDRERIVCRRIASTEARTAERSLHNSSRFQNRRRTAIFNQFHINRHGSRIHTQCELLISDIAAL